MTNSKLFDAVIIGGSYAGLSAAMALGRSLRKVLIIDGGKPCNIHTPHSHNLLTHDGKTPAEISAEAKEQVLQYPTVTFVSELATTAIQNEKGFEITTEKGAVYLAKKLIFATGLNDIMPETPGFSDCWGISILHCPYCHGYEVKHQKTAIIANGEVAFEIAKMISHWTNELTILTDGKSVISDEKLEKLESKGIKVIDSEIDHIQHENGYVKNVIFKDGSKLPLKAIYARPHAKQQCELPETLGCDKNDHGCIQTDTFQKTSVPGVYAAGDCATVGRSLAVAIAAGSVAGAFLNKELIEEAF